MIVSSFYTGRTRRRSVHVIGTGQIPRRSLRAPDSAEAEVLGPCKRGQRAFYLRERAGDLILVAPRLCSYAQRWEILSPQ
jgi:hypothetical protein